MMLSRKITNRVNWILDNLVPPIVRDSKVLMKPVFTIIFGGKCSCFMDFKDQAPFLTSKEFIAYYRFLLDKHIKRDTDISEAGIAKTLDSIVGETVLDVGCGRGLMTAKIAESRNVTTYGIDMQVPEQATRRKNLSFLAGHIEMLPFLDKTFDTVLCAHTLEHVQNLQKAVAELRRVAKKRLIVIVPRQREYRYTFDLHLHFFPYSFSVQQVMKNNHAECTLIDNDWFYSEDIL